jgi:hypothetical protein
MMQLEFLDSELNEISDNAYEYEWSVMEDETLIDALSGNSDDLYEFRFMFSDLASRCESLREALENTHVSEHFNDLFVGIVGNKFNLVGFDSFEEDYFALASFQTDLAQNESAKRLMRLSKETLLSVAGQCFGIAVSILDLRHTFDCLTSALELLRGNRTVLLKNIKDIEEAYEAAAQRNFCSYGRGSEAVDHFDELLLWESIQRSRATTFERFVVAMDIPLIGRTASRILGRYFNNDLEKLETAVINGLDFTGLDNFGEVLNRNIHEWFSKNENKNLWKELQKMTTIEKKEAPATKASPGNPFVDRTIVVTGKLALFTRNTINAKIEALGAKPGSAISKNTDYLICGEKAGSKLDKARSLGVTVLTEQQFLDMAKGA